MSSPRVEATHRPTGQTFAIEAESRHWAGVLNQARTPEPDDPLRADARAVRRLFINAVAKAPEDKDGLRLHRHQRSERSEGRLRV